MKFKKRFKRIFCCVLTLLFVVGGTSDYYAASKIYKIAALDVQVEIPSGLTAFTRNVTSADPGLDLINSSADEVRVMFEQYNIYLEAFPDNVAYEIVLSGKDAPAGTKDFNAMDPSEINDGIHAYKTVCESVATDTVTDITTYRNNTTTYYQVDFSSTTNDIKVYARKYYTVMQGKEISFTIQSKNAEINNDMAAQLTAVVDSAVYKNIRASITDSPYFTEIAGYLFGILFTVGIIGVFIIVMKKSTKKQKEY